MRTLAQLAGEALDVQNACNLSGVAISFAQAMRDLCEHVPDTRARNTHPIVILWIDKMASLAGIQYLGHDRTMEAYTECNRLAGRE